MCRRQHSSYAYVHCLACRDIINGYADGGTFRPGNTLTRGRLSKIIICSQAIPSQYGGHFFRDVPVDLLYHLYIQAPIFQGVLSQGYLCGSPASRAQASTSVNDNVTRGRASGWCGRGLRLALDPTPGHPDIRGCGSRRHLLDLDRGACSDGAIQGYPCGSPERAFVATYRMAGHVPPCRPYNSRGQSSKLSPTPSSGLRHSGRRRKPVQPQPG